MAIGYTESLRSNASWIALQKERQMDIVDILNNPYPTWKRGVLTFVAMMALAYCDLGHAQNGSCESGQAANSSPPVNWQDETGKRREAILEEMKEKLAKLHATDNADYDFAALQQVYANTSVKMAQEELQEGHDREMRSHAKRVLKDQTKSREETDRWVDQFHRFD